MHNNLAYVLFAIFNLSSLTKLIVISKISVLILLFLFKATFITVAIILFASNNSMNLFNIEIKCSFKVLLFKENLSIKILIIIFDSVSFNLYLFSFNIKYNESKNSKRFFINVGFKLFNIFIPIIFKIKSRLSK